MISVWLDGEVNERIYEYISIPSERWTLRGVNGSTYAEGRGFESLWKSKFSTWKTFINMKNYERILLYPTN